LAEVAENLGGVDVLVNNAGQGKGGNLDTLTPEDILCARQPYCQMGHFRFVQGRSAFYGESSAGARIIEINALAGVVPTPEVYPVR